MGLWVPTGSGDFCWKVANTDALRPARGYGTLITASGSANTKGSYATCLSALAFDAYGIFIRCSDIFWDAATATDTLVDVGVDPTGGTSFSVVIPDLYFSGTSALIHGPGMSYYFPLYIKAGSSIGLRMASPKTSNTASAQVRVYGKPRDPKSVKAGSYVTSFGVTSASSTGTAVTAGTTSEGAWTQLGANTTKDYWWFQFGAGFSTAGQTADDIYGFDLGVGDGTNKSIAIQDQITSIGSTGATASAGSEGQGAYFSKNGNGIYVRAQASGTPDASLKVAAYALGGG